MRNVLKSFALAVAGALSLSSAALAQDQVRVPYGDLDLTRPVDAAAFEARIKGAAADFCAGYRDERSKMRMSAATCKRQVATDLRSVIPAQARQNLQIARARPLPVEVAAR